MSLKTRGVQPWGVHGHSSRRPRAATLGTEPHPASSFPCAGQALGNPSNWAAALEMIPAAPVAHLPRRSSLSPPAGSNGRLLRCPPAWSAVWFPDPLRGGVLSRVHDVSRIERAGASAASREHPSPNQTHGPHPPTRITLITFPTRITSPYTVEAGARRETRHGTYRRFPAYPQRMCRYRALVTRSRGRRGRGTCPSPLMRWHPRSRLWAQRR